MAYRSSSSDWGGGGGSGGDHVSSDSMMEGDVVLVEGEEEMMMVSSAGGAVGGVGGVTSSPQPGPISVEDQLGSLQQQLSCLRTNDKEALVVQFQKIVGGPNALNAYAAHFFLDMNNWLVTGYFNLLSRQRIRP